MEFIPQRSKWLKGQNQAESQADTLASLESRLPSTNQAVLWNWPQHKSKCFRKKTQITKLFCYWGNKIKCSGNDSVDLTPRNGAMFSQWKEDVLDLVGQRWKYESVLSFIFLWLPKVCLYSLWMESLNVWVNCKWKDFQSKMRQREGKITSYLMEDKAVINCSGSHSTLLSWLQCKRQQQLTLSEEPSV